MLPIYFHQIFSSRSLNVFSFFKEVHMMFLFVCSTLYDSVSGKDFSSMDLYLLLPQGS